MPRSTNGTVNNNPTAASGGMFCAVLPTDSLVLRTAVERIVPMLILGWHLAFVNLWVFVVLAFKTIHLLPSLCLFCLSCSSSSSSCLLLLLRLLSHSFSPFSLIVSTILFAWRRHSRCDVHNGIPTTSTSQSKPPALWCRRRSSHGSFLSWHLAGRKVGVSWYDVAIRPSSVVVVVIVESCCYRPVFYTLLFVTSAPPPSPSPFPVVLAPFC